MVCLHHSQPHLSPSGCFFSPFFLSSLLPSSCVCVSLPPSATFPELTFAVRQPYYFVLQILIRILSFLCFSLSLSLSLSRSSSSGSPPQTTQSNNVSFLTRSVTFFVLSLPHSIENNLIQSISHYPIFHYTSLISHHFSLSHSVFLKVSFPFFSSSPHKVLAAVAPKDSLSLAFNYTLWALYPVPVETCTHAGLCTRPHARM